MPADALHTLAAQLRAEDTVVSPHVVDPAEDAALGELAAAGPGAAGDPAAYALVVESVREGYLLHYGRPRVIVGADADLRLLAGDYLYALGLEQLAGLGDLISVRRLSDLISLGAQLHAGGAGDHVQAAPDRARAAGDALATGDHALAAPDRARRAGEALWLATTAAIAAGEDGPLAEAAFALRAGNRGAVAALEAAAVAIADAAGLAEALAQASHSIDFPPVRPS